MTATPEHQAEGASDDDPRLGPESCASTLACGDVPETAPAGTTLTLPVTITNDGDRPLIGALPYPVVLTYRWLLLDQTWVTDGARIPLLAPLDPGASVTIDLPVVVPADRRGPAYLRISLVQELVCYFDDVNPANGIRATVYLTG